MSSDRRKRGAWWPVAILFAYEAARVIAFHSKLLNF